MNRLKFYATVAIVIGSLATPVAAFADTPAPSCASTEALIEGVCTPCPPGREPGVPTEATGGQNSSCVLNNPDPFDPSPVPPMPSPATPPSPSTVAAPIVPAVAVPLALPAVVPVPTAPTRVAAVRIPQKAPQVAPKPAVVAVQVAPVAAKPLVCLFYSTWRIDARGYVLCR